jgi:hypothetical protein
VPVEAPAFSGVPEKPAFGFLGWIYAGGARLLSLAKESVQKKSLHSAGVPTNPAVGFVGWSAEGQREIGVPGNPGFGLLGRGAPVFGAKRS